MKRQFSDTDSESRDAGAPCHRTRRYRPRTQWTRGLLAIVVAGLVAGIAIVVEPPSAAGAAQATFTWSMPERYKDFNNDGLLDAFVSSSESELAKNPNAVLPETWRVDFDACDSTGATAFEWHEADRNDVHFHIGDKACKAWGEFPEENDYNVVLTTRGPGGSDSIILPVRVQDFLIVSIGDSYGSGEGVPDRPTRISSELKDSLEQADLVARRLEEAWDSCQPVALASGLGPCADALSELLGDTLVGHVLAPIADRSIEFYRGLIRECTPINVLGIATIPPGCVAWLIGFAIDMAGDAVEFVKTLISDGTSLLRKVYDEAVDVIMLLVDGGETWQDPKCHRSTKAGSSIAARRIEELDPHSSVTFVHLACSGATILKGLLGPYGGVEDQKTELAPQVEDAEQWAQSREIDALYVSIGGNDLGFANIIVSCIALEPCNTPDPHDEDPANICAGIGENVSERIGIPASIATLGCRLGRKGLSLMDAKPVGEILTTTVQDKAAGNLVKLNEALTNMVTSSKGGDLSYQPDRVYIAEYPGLMRNQDGRLCSFEDDGFGYLPYVSAVESAYLEESVVKPLHDLIETAVTRLVGSPLTWEARSPDTGCVPRPRVRRHRIRAAGRTGSTKASFSSSTSSEPFIRTKADSWRMRPRSTRNGKSISSMRTRSDATSLPRCVLALQTAGVDRPTWDSSRTHVAATSAPAPFDRSRCIRSNRVGRRLRQRCRCRVG